MRILPLTALIYEGPISRAYMCAMRRMGVIPKTIILLVQNQQAKKTKTVLPFLPNPIRKWYFEKKQNYFNNFWPRRIRTIYSDLFETMCKVLKQLRPDSREFFEEMYHSGFDYDKYAIELKRVFLENLKDNILLEILNSLEHNLVLFTGGGIVPKQLLEVPGIRFLHIHPGHLPEVRGADGLLWSVLVRGHPSATIFYMNKGIDTGDILLVSDFPEIKFPIQGNKRPEDIILYRAVFSFFDPLIRTQLLCKIIEIDPNFSKLGGKKQNQNEGITYHFMHPLLRKLALEKIFPQDIYP